MWACDGECSAHILRHNACTEKLMAKVSSISHFILSISLEVDGLELSSAISLAFQQRWYQGGALIAKK